MLYSKIVSSLENCFIDQNLENFKTLEYISALKNERISFQVLVTFDKIEELSRYVTVEIEGELAKYTSVREVVSVPVAQPTFPGLMDDNYLRTTPGLYPDLLLPLRYDRLRISPVATSTLWIEIDLSKAQDIRASKKEIKVNLTDSAGETSSNTLDIEIIDAILPEQTLKFTEWFYTDCLANYYKCETFSEEHWRLIENFASTAAKNGINMLLTPTFTPPLDTGVGVERLTTQLVGVTVDGEDYSFDFTLLDRWIDMCDRVGIKHLEISHFFTQWGAMHAPKVVAYVDGKQKKIFGWETDATSEEYTHFLRSFIKAFLEHMKARGDDKRCYFHISDEPSAEQLESYKAAKNSISDLLEGYPIMDALSNYEFFEQGIVSLPIPATNHISPFIENKVKDLWTYYCCGQWNEVSNRFIAMPSARNRSIGMQMYKYDIVGFLHWGYNFYNTQHSYNAIDPYRDTSGDGWVPAGDTFSVYPAPNGEAYESLRIIVFNEALQDMRAMQLAESLCGKEKVIKAIEYAFGKTVTFNTCARHSFEILQVREAINKLIKENL